MSLSSSNPRGEAISSPLVAKTLVDELDLPKVALEKKQQMVMSSSFPSLAAMSLELAIGRIAMISAMLFLGVEISTGKSLPEQLMVVTQLVN